jgi:SAM-dependent methyltransferase
MSEPEADTGGPWRSQALLIGTLMAKFASRALSVAAELDVAGHLAHGPKAVEDLAAVTATDSDSLGRMLRALSAEGIFEESAPGVFANSASSELLRSDVDGSLRAMAVWMGHDLHSQLVNALGPCVRSGDSAAAVVFGGRSTADVIAESDELRAVFGEAMTAKTAITGRALVEGLDLSGFGRIVDVGGGYGGLAVMIADRYPEAEVTLYDRPRVVADASRIWAGSRPADHVAFVGGDFFEEVPGPADAYVMKSVIHDWSDDDAARILRNCRTAMADGRVFVCEAVVGGPHEKPGARLLDLELLVGPGGRERSEEEYGRLFASAGLELVAVHPTPGPVVALEARAAPVR